jgi:hypothetical protein
MRIIAAIAVASALFAVGGGCSRPWQAFRADSAPLNPSTYGQTRYENSFDPTSQYPDGERAALPNPSGPVSEPQPWPGARKVKTITIPAPAANQ